MKPQRLCDHESPDGRRAADGRESRCICGSLLARLTEEGVELKCRRCKRIVLVRWSQGGRRSLPGASHDSPP